MTSCLRSTQQRESAQHPTQWQDPPPSGPPACRSSWPWQRRWPRRIATPCESAGGVCLFVCVCVCVAGCWRRPGGHAQAGGEAEAATAPSCNDCQHGLSSAARHAKPHPGQLSTRHSQLAFPQLVHGVPPAAACCVVPVAAAACRPAAMRCQPATARRTFAISRSCPPASAYTSNFLAKKLPAAGQAARVNRAERRRAARANSGGEAAEACR